MKTLITSLILIFSASICQAGDEMNWLRSETERQLSGSRVISDSGVVLQTPDGIGHYKALWTRDLYYMVKYAPGFIKTGEVRASIEYLLSGQWGDGCIPERVKAQGKAI